MSMNMCLKQASEMELARIARSGLAPDEMMSAGPQLSVEAIAQLQQRLKAAQSAMRDPRAQQMWQAQQQQLDAMMEAAAKRKSAGGGKREASPLQLHKSWHLLHYLFTGQAWDGAMPSASLLKGKEVGDDLGYGPARTLTPQETKAFAQFLAGQKPGDLVKRIDGNKMQELGIYCAEAGDDGAEELEEDVEHYFPQLQTYVDEAAQKGNGLVIWLS
jgi:hypothetical protein